MIRYCRAWQPIVQHLTAAGVGMAVFGLLFAYAGNSNLMVTIAGGMGGSLLVYLLAQLCSAGREKE